MVRILAMAKLMGIQTMARMIRMATTMKVIRTTKRMTMRTTMRAMRIMKTATQKMINVMKMMNLKRTVRVGMKLIAIGRRMKIFRMTKMDSNSTLIQITSLNCGDQK